MYNFDEVFEEYKDLVFSKVLLTVGSFEDAEEITQNVFVKIYFGLQNFRSESNIKTWIYSIVRFTCIDFIRAKREGTLSYEDVEYMDFDESADFLTQIESLEVIEHILQLLSLDERNIILLKCDDKMKFFEVAELLGVNESTIKKIFYSAKNKFIRFYKQYYEEKDTQSSQ